MLAGRVGTDTAPIFKEVQSSWQRWAYCVCTWCKMLKGLYWVRRIVSILFKYCESLFAAHLMDRLVQYFFWVRVLSLSFRVLDGDLPSSYGLCGCCSFHPSQSRQGKRLEERAQEILMGQAWNWHIISWFTFLFWHWGTGLHLTGKEAEKWLAEGKHGFIGERTVYVWSALRSQEGVAIFWWCVWFVCDWRIQRRDNIWLCFVLIH